MRIVVYGGSFNPPHRGHVEAARTVAEQLRPDRFFIMPANLPPHKQLEEGSPSAALRLDFCRLAFAEIPGAEVSELEITREGRSYTADTVDQLRAQYPEAELYLVVGTDMFLSFRSWYRWQYLLEECTLAVLGREAFDAGPIEDFRRVLEEENNARVVELLHAPLPMSSTEIREMLRMGLGSDLVPEKVYQRILQTDSYFVKPELSWLRAQTLPYLSSRRVAHVAGVESQAVLLARRWGEDPEDAAAAGILHDITKSFKPEKQLKLCQKYGIMLSPEERETPALLHARTGAAFARELFGVPDRIYSAIRWHTTGRPDMTLLEKIVYLADYTEPTRDFDGVEKLRALCFEDLDRAMALGLRMSLEEIRARGAEPFRDTVEAWEYYREFL